MALPRARAVALLLLAIHQVSIFAATPQSNVFSLSNTPSSDAVSLSNLNVSSNNDEYGDCFNPATQRRGLYPAKQEDCFNALNEIFWFKSPFRSTTFSRRYNAGFRLPRVIRNETCVISIDVVNDTDEDIFKPVQVYVTAREIALRCTQGTLRYGGRTITRPKMVIDVMVLGRVWPLESGAVEPVTLESAVVVAGERLTSRGSTLLNEPSVRLIRPPVVNTTGRDNSLSLNAPELGAPLKCYDPPLPRERAWPIDIKDCEIAVDAIIGDRQSDQEYTFSREKITTKFYYPLPTTHRYRSCVVHLDMANDSDQDTVRLAIVEATAWVLAHKCCGEERSTEQYGGRGTVNVGSKGSIKVWVYGRPWPPPLGATNATNVALAQR